MQPMMTNTPGRRRAKNQLPEEQKGMPRQVGQHLLGYMCKILMYLAELGLGRSRNRPWIRNWISTSSQIGYRALRNPRILNLNLDLKKNLNKPRMYTFL